jgi:hypothetical protein
VFGLLDKASEARVGSFLSRLPGTTEGGACMGSSWDCLLHSTQTSDSLCPPRSIPSPLPLGFVAVLFRGQPRWHSVPTPLLELAANRNVMDHLSVSGLCRSALGRRMRQSISTGTLKSEAWQIKYPRSVPDRGEAPSPGDRLQRTAAL